MHRLSTLDTLFVSFDTPEFPMHGGGLLVLDPSTASEPITFERVKDHFRRLLPVMPPMRRRLVSIPLGLDMPMWLEDPEFDLDQHMFHKAVPAPGNDRQVAELFDEVLTPFLDRSKPLWDCTFVEGLQGGRVAILLRMHHAYVDGMGGVEMLFQMFSTDPAKDVIAEIPEDDWVPDEIPNDLQMLLDAAPGLTLRPLKSIRAVAKLAIGTAKDRLSALAGGEDRQAPPPDGEKGKVFGGPKLSFNAVPERLTRRTAWVDIPFDEIKAVRAAFQGTTVNDVALALAAGGIRRYLEPRGELPDGPLTIANPLNMRETDEKGVFENRISIMTVSLPVHLPGSEERLRRISDNTKAAKSSSAASSSDSLEAVFDLVMPGMTTLIAGQVPGNPAINALPPPYNAMVSNLMGPPFPLYFCGARLEDFRIQTVQGAGVGLVIALISYAGTIQMTIAGSKETLPDVWEIADGIEAERQALAELVAEGGAGP